MINFLWFYLFLGFVFGAQVAIDEWPSWKSVVSSRKVLFLYPFFIMFFWLPFLLLLLGYAAFNEIAEKFWRKNAESSL